MEIFKKLVSAFLIPVIILLISFNLYAQDKKEVEEDETGAYYTIKKGDTLWGLSKKFLNSPWKWPELWKANSDLPIRNPNLIYPGQRIRLLPRKDGGDSGTQPQTGAAAQPGTSGPAAALSGTPASSAPGMSGAFTVSPSAPSSNFDSISDSGKNKFFYYSLIDQAGFVLRDPLMPTGRIFKVKDDKEMISSGDIVYIKESDGLKVVKNKSYTIYRILKNMIDKETNTSLGKHHFIVGVVEITSEEQGFVMGKITRSFRNIQVNDLLMPYEKRSPKILLAKGKKGLEGTVIASETHTNMMGEHSVAFINKGQEDGVIPGHKYKVFYQESARTDMRHKEKILLPPYDFASMLVLLTTPSTSTVLFTYSEKPVEPGAKFHASEE